MSDEHVAPEKQEAAATSSPSKGGRKRGGTNALQLALADRVAACFEPSNIEKDPFMLAHINAQNYIPVKIALTLPRIAELTVSEAELREAIKLIPEKVQLDSTGELVKPVLKVERSTIIVRDTPEDTTEEEIRDLFNGLEEGKCTIGEVKKDVANSWFVSLKTEDQAQDALLYLQFSKIKLRGEQVHARMKSKSAIRSFYVPPTVVVPVAYPQQGGGVVYGQYAAPAGTAAGVPHVSGQRDAQHGKFQQGRQPGGGAGGRGGRRAQQTSSGGGRGGGGGNGNSSKRGGGSGGGSGRGGNKGGRGKAPQLGMAHFPPLLGAGSGGGAALGSGHKKIGLVKFVDLCSAETERLQASSGDATAAPGGDKDVAVWRKEPVWTPLEVMGLDEAKEAEAAAAAAAAREGKANKGAAQPTAAAIVAGVARTKQSQSKATPAANADSKKKGTSNAKGKEKASTAAKGNAKKDTAARKEKAAEEAPVKKSASVPVASSGPKSWASIAR